VSGTWRRLGFVGNPAGSAPWAASHAALPVLDLIAPGEWQLFLSSRDSAGRARIGRCRFVLSPSPALSVFDPAPVLDLGALGAFDDSGVTTSCLVTHGGKKYLYYTGWSLGVTVPFYLFIGVAISTDGGRTFTRASEAPLLDRGLGDPYLTASPFVLHDEGLWRMWYISGTGWERRDDMARHFYHVKYTESADGIGWERPARVAIDYEGPHEHAFGRPCVIRDADGYWMWYSFRGDRYRIGCAWSADGVQWSRRDALGLEPSGTGWDADETAYPWVFDAGGRRYMLYNGNGYGLTGVGLAIQEPST
jgi:hypothetical protein